MKYKTFILARNTGLAALVLGGAFFGCRKIQDTPVANTTPPAAESSSTTPVELPPKKMSGTTTVAKKPATQKGTTSSRPTTVAPTTATTALTANDREVLRLRKEPLSNGKQSGDSRKWVATSDAFKAEFRADSDSSSWNRVKIDFDGDKKWDERWDFKSDGSIKRRVAPDDDENYRVEYRLKSVSDSTWIRAK